mmetsp:Transcript_11142/g.34395  ORF Transcript_11142/g.34395 Transcript_11142/m.34395 type:complete len:623 (-) Transcript_11142:38-1906(-)
MSKRSKLAEATAAAAAFIDTTNAEYERVHRAFEDQFWGTKMNLSGGFDTVKLGSTKEAMEAFLRDEDRLAEAKTHAAATKDPEQLKVLACFQRTFQCYQMSSPEAIVLREKSTTLENKLNAARNKMALGYKDPATGALVEKSSVGLRTLMRTSDDEAVRKAAWEGLRSIGDFVLEDFCEMVKLRNAMAKTLGYEDFYDYKVTQAEGFGKAKLFAILDTLRGGSDELLKAARDALGEAKGAAALEPYNMSFAMAGDVEKELSPYFPFEKAVEAWGRSFSRLGITYRGATMYLDLLDRKGKYSNGFCHWPQPAWRKADGSWQPTVTNFTSLADPTAVGSGKTALATLMHEAGHAAHFSNILQPSPLFSQERAPTSVAYAENQSMFLDSLVGDAAWRARYAKDRTGTPLPWALHEKDIKARHPYEVFQLRGMLAVPYYEKALYELAEADVTPAKVAALADKIEHELQGGLASRPLMSVPHILSDEASCYYHGYVLAEMSVHQTREHFGGAAKIVDNAAVGAALADVYWAPGNSENFLDLVEKLTGKPLTGDPWIASLKTDVDALVADEKRDYDAFVKPVADGPVNLDMVMKIVDGDELIADSEAEGGFLAACTAFERYLATRFGV